MRHRLEARHLAEMLGRYGGIVLPAGIAEHKVTRPPAPARRRHDFGDATAGHHGVGLDRRAIGRAVHPGAVGGVQRNVAHPQQRLAVLWLRDGGFGHFEVLRTKLAGRLLDQQNLTIDGVVHGVPPEYWLSVPARVQKTPDPPCALPMTLVGGRPFHNGNKWQTWRCPGRVVRCRSPNLWRRRPIEMTTVSLTLSQVFEFALKAS